MVLNKSNVSRREGRVSEEFLATSEWSLGLVPQTALPRARNFAVPAYKYNKWKIFFANFKLQKVAQAASSSE